MDAGGALSAIEDALMLNRRTQSNQGLLGDYLGAAFREGVNGVIDVLIARKRWIEAFEFAFDHAQTRLAEVLGEAGNAYFEAGESSDSGDICQKYPVGCSGKRNSCIDVQQCNSGQQVALNAPKGRQDLKLMTRLIFGLCVRLWNSTTDRWARPLELTAHGVVRRQRDPWHLSTSFLVTSPRPNVSTRRRSIG